MLNSRAAPAALVLALVTPLACQAPPDPPARRILRLTSGTQLTATLAREFERSIPGLEVELVPVSGSGEAVGAVESARADLCIALADVVYARYVDRDGTRTSPSPLRGVAVVGPTPLHLLARADSTIRELADLPGHTVGMGPVDGGTTVIAELVIAAIGIDARTLHTDTSPFRLAVERLRRGALDAMFYGTMYPDELLSPALAAGARLIPVQGRPIQNLLPYYPFLRLSRIPADAYPNQPGSTRTIAVDQILVVRAGIDADLVYQLTRRFIDALPRLVAFRRSLGLADPDEAPASPIPLHPGAARYYREQELRQ